MDITRVMNFASFKYYNKNNDKFITFEEIKEKELERLKSDERYADDQPQAERWANYNANELLYFYDFNDDKKIDENEVLAFRKLLKQAGVSSACTLDNRKIEECETQTNFDANDTLGFYLKSDSNLISLVEGEREKTKK